MKLNKLQTYLLDRLSPEFGEKVLNYATDLVTACKKYLRKIHLEAKREKIMATLPKDAKPLGTLLDTVITHTINGAETTRGIDQLEITGELLPHYYALTRIVSIQPIAGPIGQVHYLHYKDSENKKELAVMTQNCECGSTRYRYRQNIEAITDLNVAYDSVDINKLMAKDFGEEIISEVINDLVHISSKVKVSNEIIKNDRLTTVFCNLNMASSKIAVDSYRGRATFMVLNTKTFVDLVADDNDALITTMKDDVTDSTSLRYVGILGGQYRIYINNTLQDHNILIGYNGASTIDSGLIYAPYLPVVSSGLIIDPETYTPTMRFMKRGAKVACDNYKSYYTLVDISDLYAQ